ncbi:MAG: ferredoxin [Emcibacter sp.]|nr:ferredoxin [Emcibacter sp.]
MTAITIMVEPGKCQGHARCYSFAPEIFDLDDEGYIALEKIIVSGEDEELAREAVEACPENALKIVGE